MPEMRRKGLQSGIAGVILAGVGTGFFVYNNGRHILCQNIGQFGDMSGCHTTNIAWTIGLVLLIGGVVTFAISLMVAVTTEPQPVEVAEPGRHLTLWIGLGVLGAIVVAVLAVSLL